VRVMFNYNHTDFDDNIVLNNRIVDNEDVYMTRFQIVW